MARYNSDSTAVRAHMRSLLLHDQHTLHRNVPGVALYFTGLSQFRIFLSTSPYFKSIRSEPTEHGSTLPKLTSGGNLIAGAVTRVSVGFVLNPFSVLKARYEVCRLVVELWMRCMLFAKIFLHS